MSSHHLLSFLFLLLSFLLISSSSWTNATKTPIDILGSEGTSDDTVPVAGEGRVSFSPLSKKPVPNQMVFIGSTLTLLTSGTTGSHSMILASAGGGSNLISTRNIGDCGFLLLPPTSPSPSFQSFESITSPSSEFSLPSWLPGASSVVLRDTGQPPSILDVVAFLYSISTPSTSIVPPVIYIWIQAEDSTAPAYCFTWILSPSLNATHVYSILTKSISTGLTGPAHVLYQVRPTDSNPAGDMILATSSLSSGFPQSFQFLYRFPAQTFVNLTSMIDFTIVTPLGALSRFYFVYFNVSSSNATSSSSSSSSYSSPPTFSPVFTLGILAGINPNSWTVFSFPIISMNSTSTSHSSPPSTPSSSSSSPSSFPGSIGGCPHFDRTHYLTFDDSNTSLTLWGLGIDSVMSNNYIFWLNVSNLLNITNNQTIATASEVYCNAYLLPYPSISTLTLVNGSLYEPAGVFFAYQVLDNEYSPPNYPWDIASNIVNIVITSDSGMQVIGIEGTLQPALSTMHNIRGR